MCDEKNYRLYHTDGKFPLTISGVASRSLKLSNNYTRYANVNYLGIKNYVIMGCYPEWVTNYDYVENINMRQVSTLDGYTHTAMVDLGNCDYYNVYFYDSGYVTDDIGYQDYKIYPGENNFETSECIDPLKMNLLLPDRTDYTTGDELSLSVSASGGVGPYRFRYTVRDNQTGKVVFNGKYGYKTNSEVYVNSAGYGGKNNSYTFDKAGDYLVTVYARDITGNTVYKSFDAKVRDFEFISLRTGDGKTVYNAGDNVYVILKTKNDSYNSDYYIMILLNNEVYDDREFFPYLDDYIRFDCVELDQNNRSATVTIDTFLRQKGDYHVIVYSIVSGKPVYSDMKITVK